MNSPLLVSGDDLERVCSEIRARGGVVSALETGVGNKNSQYRVSYFCRMTEEPQSVTGRSGNAGHAGPAAIPNLGAPEREARAVEIEPRTPEAGSNPAASTNFERGDTPDEGSSSKDKQQASENHFGKVATVRGFLLQDAGRARNAMTRKPSSVCAEPAALTNLTSGTGLQARTEVVERGLEAVPSAEHSGPSDNMLSPSTAAGYRLMEPGSNPGAFDSIQARLDRLRLNAIASGRITKPSRFKPLRETRPCHNDP